MTNLINLTPHSINVVTGENVQTFEPSGTVARCSVNSVESGNINGITTFKEITGEVVDLPEPQPGTLFIVSRIVFETAKDRTDLISPITSRAVRDDNGNIVGVPGFVVK